MLFARATSTWANRDRFSPQYPWHYCSIVRYAIGQNTLSPHLDSSASIPPNWPCFLQVADWLTGLAIGCYRPFASCTRWARALACSDSPDTTIKFQHFEGAQGTLRLSGRPGSYQWRIFKRDTNWASGWMRNLANSYVNLPRWEADKCSPQWQWKSRQAWERRS